MKYAEFMATYRRIYGGVDSDRFYMAAGKAFPGLDLSVTEYETEDLKEIHRELAGKEYKPEIKEDAIIRVLPSFSQRGLWWRASSYKLKDGWIEGSRKVEQYSVPEVLEKLFDGLVDLGTNVRMRQVEKGPIELAPEEHERYLEFCSRFGLLGLGFRRVDKIIFYPPPGDTRIELEAGGIRQDSGEFLGEYLRAPAHDFKSLYANYREPVFDFVLTAVNFSLTARRIARRIEDPLGLEDMAEAFTHARPRISTEAGGLSIEWEPNSLIDAAYLHLYRVTTEDGLEVCRDPKCGKVFRKRAAGPGRPRLYCSRACQERHGKEKQRRG